ncbi:hypothetical protein [Mycobacterium sp. Aquia_213]|uniref:hypothetical protein n=1 Tax=Mycobacterium sp. Aquia_213 TaxID=2991728 RepID=UPI00226FD5C3|nr:hypothetical protein [Mycobacterium sp. Aquia_213]WAC93205.1 hypothetical protein LMQ14_08775 [Mycobacterium sp. Aquia_213]
MSATTLDRNRTRDGLLRLAMRADAAITGLAGLAGVPLAGWLATTSGTTKAFEYGMAAFFIAYGVLVLWLASLPSVRRAGMAVVLGNLLYTVAAVVLVLADVFPLTATGVVATLGSGIYTLFFAELQYQGWRRART